MPRKNSFYTMYDYNLIIRQSSERVFEVMAPRVSEEDLGRIKDAFAFAQEKHSLQKRKSGEPYIIHPIAVALIAAEELKLDTSSVITAFLHDVVEDTDVTVDEIRERFGSDVASLVDIVTKKKKDQYNITKQGDNYKQLLDSLHYDIRALMIKLADRLHNMRTLSSMKPEKQMKIAGETDFFYAPLANRLGLFDVKTELENLSFRFRCEQEYEELEEVLYQDKLANFARQEEFTHRCERLLKDKGIIAKVVVYYRKPYSIYRRMKQQGVDFKHLDNRYYVRVTFDDGVDDMMTDKAQALRIYNILTDYFKEKPGSFMNLIDQAKENSYQCLRVMLLSKEGVWEDVQICSYDMVAASKIGCMAELGNNIGDWIKRFRKVLQDIAEQRNDSQLLEQISDALYYDDVMVFTTDGSSYILPAGSTAIDFAFKQSEETGLHALYARINGKLMSIKTQLQRGDCVGIGTDERITVEEDWLKHSCTYFAKSRIRRYLATIEDPMIMRCPLCRPLPGGETIGIRDENSRVTIHRRSCPEAIRLASKYGDSIAAVELKESPSKLYPVTIGIHAIDRDHLLADLIDHITNVLHLGIDALNTTTTDALVDCKITFFVHSQAELTRIIRHLYDIKGVDEVYSL